MTETNDTTAIIDRPAAGARNATRRSPSPAEEATILVIEDDPILQSTLSYNLLRAGFRVVTASDGEAGLAVARREGDYLDLVLLDLMLPGMNGFQVLRLLRTTSDVPVLILSAR